MNPTLPLPLDVRLMDAAAKALCALALLLGLGALAAWALRHPVWSLSAITLAGDVQHQHSASLRAHLAGHLYGNTLTIDLHQVQQRVQEAPWVRRAVVQRAPPQRLRITLEEHRAVAWWGQAGAARLLNEHGEVFEAETAAGQGLEWSVLDGPSERAAEVLQHYRAWQPLLAALGWRIARLELDARGSWRVLLSDGARLELGRGSSAELQARLERFTRSVPALLLHYGQRPLQVADLRHPDGYALRIEGVGTLPELKLPAPVGRPTAAPTPAAPSPSRP